MQYSDPYTRLRLQVEQAGLFKRRYDFYALYSVVIVSVVSACLTLLTVTDNVVVQLINAVVLAMAMMHIGFLGHDIGHGQVFESKTAGRWIGSAVYALGLGISLDFWYGGHNEHHKHTNQLDHDPDIGIPLVFDPGQLERKGYFFRTFILPVQHWLFFVIMPLSYVNYIARSIPWDLRRLKNKIRLFEFVLIIIHFAALFGLVFTYLGVGVGILFLFVNTAVAGIYAGFSFAPNHKGEKILEADEKVTYITQIVCTRNIKPSPVTDLALGGLNYQIEHHLFPYLPRPNLGRVQPIVKEFCRTESLPYNETSFGGSFKEIYRSLKENAAA